MNLDQQVELIDEVCGTYREALRKHGEALRNARHDFENVLMNVADWAEARYGCESSEVFDWPAFDLQAQEPVDLGEQLRGACAASDSERRSESASEAQGSRLKAQGPPLLQAQGSGLRARGSSPKGRL